MKKLFLPYWILIIAIFLGLPITVRAKPADLEYNLRAEQWVNQQLTAGKVADLAMHYPNPADRVIRASFLQNLLEFPSEPIRHHGIWIRGATIVGDLTLEHTDINFPVSVENSTFQNYVSFCRSHFYKLVSFEGSTFNSNVNLCETKVDESLLLSRTNFDGCFTLSGAQLGGNLTLNEAHFNSEGQTASMSGMQVGKTIFLANATFAGEAVFDGTKVSGDFTLAESHFNNKDKTAKFTSLNVGKSIFLGKTSFEGGADFRSSQIEGHFNADDVVFNNPTSLVTFNYMFVAGEISLNRAIFKGQTTFEQVKNDGNFVATDAQFTNIEHSTSFQNIFVGESVFLRNAVFNGPVSFGNANIGEHFLSNGTQFNSQKNEASFSSMTVGKDFDVQEAVFNGPANFTFMDIGNVIYANKTRFNSKDGMVDFGSSRAMDLRLNDSIFLGPIDTRYIRLDRNFEAIGAQFMNIEKGAYLQSMRIREHLFINQSKFEGKADFSFVQVGGILYADDSQFNSQKDAANFSNMVIGDYFSANRAVFSGPVTFNNTTTTGFYADNTTWPQAQGLIDVRGLAYEDLNVRSKDGQGFLFLLDQSPYDGRSYHALEKYYLSAGFPSYADKIYVTYKMRETTNGLPYDSWQWWWNLFLGGFIIFGKGPELAVLWFALIVGFGYLMFRKKEKMAAIIETNKRYRPFLYSLDLFLPLVNLGYASIWSPAPEYKITRIYAVIHKYLGLILIPIAILAFLGIIK